MKYPTMMKYQTMQTPIGKLLITADEQAIHHMYFEDSIDLDKLQLRVGDLGCDTKHALLQQAKHQLQDYFSGKRQQFELPLAPQGTAFQQSVWSTLQHIRYGITWSYEDLATRLDKPTATRAVGNANGKNPISIVIPCHRVIGKNGTLTGYAGGVERKAWLLDLERQLSGGTGTLSLF